MSQRINLAITALFCFMVRGVVLTWGVAVKTKITLSVTACHLSRRERLFKKRALWVYVLGSPFGGAGSEAD